MFQVDCRRHSEAMVDACVDFVEVRNERYVSGVSLTVMAELGHESLAMPQAYLADVCKPGEAKKAVAHADSFPSRKSGDGHGW